MRENFLALGEWAPDNRDRDNIALQVAENVLPLYRTYRIIPKLTLHSESPDDAGDSYPLTGGISHLFDSALAVSTLRPDSDEASADTYVNETGNPVSQGEQLFPSIGETNANPQTFIYSRTENTDVYIAGLSDPTFIPSVDTDHKIKFQYFINDLNGVGWTIRIRLLESGVVVDPGADPVEIELTGAGNKNLTYDEFELSIAQAGAITNYNNLQLEFFGTLNSFFNNKSYKVVGDSNIGGGWDNGIPDDSVMWDKLQTLQNDTFPNNSIEFRTLNSTPSGAQGFAWFNLPTPIGDPIIRDNYKIQLRAQGLTGNCKCLVSIHDSTQDNLQLASNEFTIDQTMTTHEYILSEAEMDAFETFNGLKIRVVPQYDGEDTIFRMSFVDMTLPKGEGVGLTWAEFEIPDDESLRRLDILRRYVGDKTKLYEIRENETKWVDVSNYAYGAAAIPQSWNMISWGSEVYAVNFVDVPQLKTLGNATFIDAIVSDDKPQAKYICAVQEHVLLGNINPDSTMPAWTNVSIVPSSDMICWSHEDDATRFDIANLTFQSSFMRLRDTPGQITGMVGGEYALVFKRNSVYRINYVGPPFTFGRDLLSKNIGCYYPRSIVQAGMDVYFIGNGGIYVIRNGEQIERIGTNQVLRYLFDAENELAAVNQPAPQVGSTSDADLDSILVGAYDSFTDVIWWQYIVEGAGQFYNHTRLLLYSVRENRFSTALLEDYRQGDEDVEEVITSTPRGEGDNFDHLLGELNTATSVNSLSKAILNFTWKPDNTELTKHQAWQFISPATPEATLRSKTLSAHYISGKAFTNIQINAIRVVATPTDPSGTRFGGARLHMRASEHPVLENGWRSSTTDNSTADEDGWFALNPPAHGEYFDWEITLPEFNGNNIREIIGVDIRFAEGGKH